MKPKYISYDPSFEKHFNKYKKHLTDTEKERLKKTFGILKEDIFDKRLKTHKLKGNLKDYHAFSISYSDRIVFRILEDGGIYFIEIGGHDVCY